MLRSSIARQMAVVLVIAVGLAAALAGAFAFAAVVLSGATLGAFLARGAGRAFFLGAAVVGWACMLVAFGTSPNVRLSLPTVRPIIRVYEAIHGPGPAAFPTREEASRWIVQTSLDVNRAITVGHALISLTVALACGTVLGLVVGLRRRRADSLAGSLGA